MAAHQAPPSLGFSRQEHWSGLPFLYPMHESEKWKRSRSVVSDPQQPHGLQPVRLLRPWDFPGKSTGVGCHCLLQRILLQQTNHTSHLLLIYFYCYRLNETCHYWKLKIKPHNILGYAMLAFQKFQLCYDKLQKEIWRSYLLSIIIYYAT